MDSTQLKARLGDGKKGTYVLCLSLDNNQTIQIGRLGQHLFAAGFYYYVGSAFGPGGVAARCKHHLNSSPSPRWHIDYLRAHASIDSILFNLSNIHFEHEWARLFLDTQRFTLPMPGFGASDCACPSHLLFSAHRQQPQDFIEDALWFFTAHKKGG